MPFDNFNSLVIDQSRNVPTQVETEYGLLGVLGSVHELSNADRQPAAGGVEGEVKTCGTVNGASPVRQGMDVVRTPVGSMPATHGNARSERSTSEIVLYRKLAQMMIERNLIHAFALFDGLVEGAGGRAQSLEVWFPLDDPPSRRNRSIADLHHYGRWIQRPVLSQYETTHQEREHANRNTCSECARNRKPHGG